MKKNRILCLILSVVMLVAMLPSMASATDTANEGRIRRIFVMGDSMAASYPVEDYPRMGWGQALQSYFDSEELLVANRAVAGASSRNYYNDPFKDDPTQSDWHCWSTVWGNYPEDPTADGFDAYESDENVLQAGDYVIFTFGANDVNRDDDVSEEDLKASPSKAWLQRNANPSLPSDSEYVDKDNGDGTTTRTYSYKWYMKNYVELIRSRGAIPIIITPPERRVNPSTKVHAQASSLEKYEEAIKELADELNGDDDPSNDFICLTDVSDLTLALYEGLGDTATGSQKLFLHLAENQYPSYDGGAAKGDNTHFRDFGAAEISGIIVEELLKHTSSELNNLKSALKTVSTPVIYDRDHNTAGTAIKMTDKRTVNTTIYPRAQFINKRDSAVNIKPVVAGYDTDGNLTNISMQDEITVPGKSVISFDSPYTMPAEPHAGKIRMFVWDFESLIPVGEEVNEETFKKTDTMPNMYFADDFEDYQLGRAINGQGGWEENTNMYVIDTWNGSKAMSIPAGGGTARQTASKEFDRITIGPNAAADMETVIECDVNMGLYTYLKIRCGNNSVLEVGYQNNRLYHYGYNPPTADENGTVTKGAKANVYSTKYLPNNDVHFKIVINEKACTATIYVNNAKVFTDQPIYAWTGSKTLGTPTYTYINKVLVNNSNNTSAGAAKVDNLMVYRQKINSAN